MARMMPSCVLCEATLTWDGVTRAPCSKCADEILLCEKCDLGKSEVLCLRCMAPLSAFRFREDIPAQRIVIDFDKPFDVIQQAPDFVVPNRVIRESFDEYCSKLSSSISEKTYPLFPVRTGPTPAHKCEQCYGCDCENCDPLGIDLFERKFQKWKELVSENTLLEFYEYQWQSEELEPQLRRTSYSRCSKCNGRGKVVWHGTDAQGSHTRRCEDKCDACNGTGGKNKVIDYENSLNYTAWKTAKKRREIKTLSDRIAKVRFACFWRRDWWQRRRLSHLLKSLELELERI
jgi:hypothetical protein